MKSLIWICLFVATLLSGCTFSGISHLEYDSYQPTIESFDVKQVLHLQESQDYDIFDYQDNVVLILVSDRSKQNPIDINDQVNTTYYERFVLFDLSLKEIKEDLPLQKFGICRSALSSFDGVVFSFFEVTPDHTLTSSIQFISSYGIRCIYNGNFSAFGMGPILQHYDNAILFSYLERENNAFGVMKITNTIEVEPILYFSTEEFDYISDDFKASKNSYGYAIGDAGKVTFCVGTSAGLTNQISLPEGKRIHGFDVTDEMLIVSLAADKTDLDGLAGILIFNLATGEPILENVDSADPLYSISVNEHNQMCGFCKSTLQLYTLQDRIEEIPADTSTVSGGFFKILSNGSNFLVATYGYNKRPEFWVVSLNG